MGGIAGTGGVAAAGCVAKEGSTAGGMAHGATTAGSAALAFTGDANRVASRWALKLNTRGAL